MRQFLKSMPVLSAVCIGFGMLLIVAGLIVQRTGPPYLVATGGCFLISGVASALPVHQRHLRTISRVLQALLLLAAMLSIVFFTR